MPPRPSRPSRPDRPGRPDRSGRPERRFGPRRERPNPERVGRPQHRTVAKPIPKGSPTPVQPTQVDTPATPAAEEFVPEMIYGRHAVLAALGRQRSLNRVWIVPNLRYDPRFHTLLQAAKGQGTVIDEVDYDRLNQLVGKVSHQGVAAQVAPFSYTDLDVLIQQAKAVPEPILVAVDSLNDPQNLGAIIRTTEALGGQGVVVPQRRCVGVTGAVAKVAAGALEYLPVTRVVNLNQALETLKAQGFWIYGLATQGATPLPETRIQGPAVLVVGAEDEGLSLLTQRHCDALLTIPLVGRTPSLNAGMACGMALYEIRRQRWLDRLHLHTDVDGKIISKSG